jgi:hypothetical protein
MCHPGRHHPDAGDSAWHEWASRRSTPFAGAGRHTAFTSGGFTPLRDTGMRRPSGTAPPVTPAPSPHPRGLRGARYTSPRGGIRRTEPSHRGNLTANRPLARRARRRPGNSCRPGAPTPHRSRGCTGVRARGARHQGTSASTGNNPGHGTARSPAPAGMSPGQAHVWQRGCPRASPEPSRFAYLLLGGAPSRLLDN